MVGDCCAPTGYCWDRGPGAGQSSARKDGGGKQTAVVAGIPVYKTIFGSEIEGLPEPYGVGDEAEYMSFPGSLLRRYGKNYPPGPSRHRGCVRAMCVRMV